VLGYVGRGISLAEDEVLDGDDGDVGRGPVGNEVDEVLEALEEGFRRVHGHGDGHDGVHHGEGEARDPDEERDQQLEAERDGIHGGGKVADDGEREEDSDEFAETARWLEHCFEDAADDVLLVSLNPGWIVSRRAADGCTEDHKWHRWNE